MIYWFFGYPGIGKDYCAEQLSKIGKFPHIDADDFLTKNDREKLLKGTFSVEDRLKKLQRIVSSLRKLLKTDKDIAIGDSLPDNKSRKFILNSFPNNIKLILITADSEKHKKRISNRKNHFFTEELLEDYKKKWEEISVRHIVFENNNTKDLNSRLKHIL